MACKGTLTVLNRAGLTKMLGKRALSTTKALGAKQMTVR